MKKQKKAKVYKEKKQTLKNVVVTLLQGRNDITRLMLPKLTGKSQAYCDVTLTNLRKAGIRVSPVNGAGTPLRIAYTQSESARFINWRRGRFLGTIKRMVIAEAEIGDQHMALANKPQELLEEINESTKNGI